MQVRVTLPELRGPTRLIFGRPLSEPQYWDFAVANPDLPFGRTPRGEIVILPCRGAERFARNVDVVAQLSEWAEQDGRGKVFGSSAHYLLRDGSALSASASWVTNETIRRLTRRQRRQFLPVCPEFVVEVLSPSDPLKSVKAKMEQWIANGVQLAWLIDGDRETVHIYRPGHPPKTRKGIQQIAGEGPVAGFVLKLQATWKGLS
jgi:Uma2 family endonuclease